MHSSKKKVIAVFDIGKTNKKFFLFDKNYLELHREYHSIVEIKDEDGYPTEDLDALILWMNEVIEKIVNSGKFHITAINFSTYGASLVHLDEKGNPVTPLYNYTKPLPNKVIEQFYAQYGPEDEFSLKTGASRISMLNSGIQLYWLKYEKPNLFKKISSSLHFPQFLSYLFSGTLVSDYTSIGCHTSLWDYQKKDYHKWVYDEGLHHLLAPIVNTQTTIDTTLGGEPIKVGVGIHDSSSALLPYLLGMKKEFLLLSTGTWNIVLNPFQKSNPQEFVKDSDHINYMRIDGKVVRAARLFMGNEYNHQVGLLTERYSVAKDAHKKVCFSNETLNTIKNDFEYTFHWKDLESDFAPNTTVYKHTSFDAAYHQLMVELVLLQVKKIKEVNINNQINRLYIDGGFSGNEVFLQLLALSLPEFKIWTTDASLGSALGAAVVISDKKFSRTLLKENYALKKMYIHW